MFTPYCLCSVRLGLLSPLEDILSTVGDIMKNLGGDVQYRGDILSTVRGVLYLIKTS